MFVFLLVVFVVVAVFLVLIVLLQMSRGAEMGAAFGGSAQSQLPYTPENYLGKVTTYLAIVYMCLAFALAYVTSQDRGQSVLDSAIPLEEPLPQSNVSDAVQTDVPTDLPSDQNVDSTTVP